MDKRLLAALVPLAFASGCKSDNRPPVVVQPIPPTASTPAAAPQQPVPLPSTPAATPVPRTGALWRWDATTVAPFGIHAKPVAEWGANPRVTLVNVGNRPAVRLLTMPGDDHLFGSNDAQRCDLRLSNVTSDATEGREWWFRHGIWFPSDYVDLPGNGIWQWGAALDWHDDADTPGSQGPVQIVLFPRTPGQPGWPTGMHLQVYGGAPGGKALGDFPIAPIERNRWYDFVLHIRWTSTTAGFCDGWVNDQQFTAYRGPTLITGHGAYLKLANYHMATADSAILHGRIDVAETREALEP